MTDHELFKKILFALEWNLPIIEDHGEKEQFSLQHRSINALRERLKLPDQEPVAWVCYGAPGKRDIDFEEADINGLPIGTFLYTTPPQRPWISLTDNEFDSINPKLSLFQFYKAIEAKLKEKNIWAD
jgi:hypothetical protein